MTTVSIKDLLNVKAPSSGRPVTLAAPPAATTRDISSSSLGSWVQDCPSGDAPSIDQPILKANNVTLTQTYNFGHQDLGSTSNAGGHTIIMLIPQTMPAQSSAWIIYADITTNFPYLVTPTTITTASSKQLLCNSSALALSNGTTWTYTVSFTGGSAVVTVFCALGSNIITVLLTFTYTAIINSGQMLVVPLQNASGTQTVFGTPISGVGGVGTYGNVSNPAYWIMVNGLVPASPPNGVPNVYQNAIVVPLYSQDANYSMGAYFSFLG